ncbi:MAG: response regulator transcription factor [Candidatus Methylomirabilia bacterium]
MKKTEKTRKEKAKAPAREKILVVEDEEDILELISYNLNREGYRVSTATTGEEGLRLAMRDKPDLIVLDLMLPGIDGIEVCRRLKADPQIRYIPVVMVTAKGEEADVVTGLELGADDYLTKPFSPKVLVARLRAVIRRREQESVKDAKEPIQRGEILIHPGRREVLLGGSRIALDLTFTEFNILYLLASRPGWVFTRAQIVDAVRGYDYNVTERSVDVHVVGLRRKLGPHGEQVETVRGVGYRFREA